MPTPTPSISRDKSYTTWEPPPRGYEDPTQFSSILGKRARVLGADAAAQPDAKRIASQTSTFESRNDRDDDASTPRSGSSSSSSEDETPEMLESDSKPRPTNGTEGEIASCELSSQTAIWDHPSSSSGHAANNSETAEPLRKHTFATHRILRRHSLSSPYAEDNYRAGAGTQRREGYDLDAICLPQTRRRGFPSVYRISCEEKGSKHHPTFFYEDDPGEAVFTDRRRSSHLAGNKPVYQLRDYVKKFQQSSFVIVKNRTCKNQIDIWYSQNRYGYNETMIILSDDLRKAIQKVATCPLDSVDQDRAGTDELLEMGAPYLFLYHHRELLRVYSQSAAAPLRMVIDAVLEYLNHNYAHDYAEANELISRGMITIDHLEKLYHPNQLLVDGKGSGSFNHRLEDRAVHVICKWPRMAGLFLTLSFWCWRFDGYFCERHMKTIGMSIPTEDKAEPFRIDKLSLHPASLLSKESIELFRQRGKIFWSLRLPNFVYYNNNRHRSRADYAKPGRYMIDFEIHARFHRSGLGRSEQEIRNKQTDPWRISLRQSDEPEEDEFLIMPTLIPGYDFVEKEWVNLSVSDIKPIKWNKQPYEDLVLPEATKLLVKAMVTVRASSIKNKEKRADFDIISGKGNGLIMLFHGSPGTGKTLTAESVAEIAEMPLYPITCGDIGIEPDKVEQYLQLVFQLGKRWNCVLLLDEADVFLEERTLTDLQRNSLVSVFLRMLEYYEGILILTSNRVGTFDDAFRSRIHIALHYEDLKPRSRKQIWSNFLTRLEGTEEGENVEEIRDRLDELAKHNLNGREIRNALSTARQLAAHGGEKMKWEHLELAIKTANDFGSYLRDVHGHSDREWAREARTR